MTITFTASPTNPTEQKPPETEVTKEMRYLEVVKKCGWNLYDIPRWHRSPEICLAAVQKHGTALEYVSKIDRSPEICLAAVQQNAGL